MDKLREISGVGMVTAEKLHNAGYDNLNQIASATVDELIENIGVSARAAERIIESAQEKVQETQSRESQMQSTMQILQDLQAPGTVVAESEEEIMPEAEVDEVPTETELPPEEIDETKAVEEETWPELEQLADVDSSEIVEKLPSEAPEEIEAIEEEVLTEPEEVIVAEVPAEEEVTEEVPEELSSEASEETEAVEKEVPPEAELSDAESFVDVSPVQVMGEDLYRQVIDELAETVVQDAKIMEKLAKDIGSELANDIMKSPEIREKIFEKALARPSFRKMLISRIVKKLS